MRQSDGRPTKTVCQHCTVDRPCWTSGPCQYSIESTQPVVYAKLDGQTIKARVPQYEGVTAYAQVRWVHRDIKGWTTPVLQQLWGVDGRGGFRLEWRDVPVEVEDGSPPLGNPPKKV